MESFRLFLEMPAEYTPISKGEMEEFLQILGFYVKQPMNDLLDADGHPVIPGNVQELVYGKRAERGGVPFSIRVYTGINRRGGQSREKGKDAIRVEVYYKNRTGESIRLGGSKRVHRTQNWRINLGKRVTDWESSIGPPCQCGAPKKKVKWKGKEFWGCAEYPNCPAQQQPQAQQPQAQQPQQQTVQADVPNCPECGDPMVNRKSQFGEFWGCSNYPDCKGTRRVA